MKALSDITAKVTAEKFSRKYISLGRIVNEWPDIIGKDLATKAQPVKIQYRKKKDNAARGEKPEARLDIAVSSADATMLHYRKDLILERINQIFGERWITSIRFVQTAVNTQKKPKRLKIKKVLDLGAQEEIKTHLTNITDEELLDRLRSIGQSIYLEEQK